MNITDKYNRSYSYLKSGIYDPKIINESIIFGIDKMYLSYSRRPVHSVLIENLYAVCTFIKTEEMSTYGTNIFYFAVKTSITPTESTPPVHKENDTLSTSDTAGLSPSTVVKTTILMPESMLSYINVIITEILKPNLTTSSAQAVCFGILESGSTVSSTQSAKTDMLQSDISNCSAQYVSTELPKLDTTVLSSQLLYTEDLMYYMNISSVPDIVAKSHIFRSYMNIIWYCLVACLIIILVLFVISNSKRILNLKLF
ncbi:hypothetical protein RF11_07687 [Thelohanellus kitauei]|uniref:Uncharacterized protein n=1 Tax=Thelohanellus kitauei TaxID=669202 RepID=A0A0C2MSR8_THEKT|nr:hypothetical protein RF11_07687 [Thelohanellus kitauei]